MQNLMGTGIDWPARRLIRKFYMDQSFKAQLDQGETQMVKMERGVRQGCYLSPILSNLYAVPYQGSSRRVWSL